MNNFFCNHKTQKSDPEHTFSEIDINYRRDYSKGKSFKVSIWNEIDTYNNDDFIQDFVIYNQSLWARIDSTPSTNEVPTEGPWAKVMDGVSDVQFKEEGNKIFWKYEDESEWKDLFELDVVSESEIKNMLKDIATDVDSNFYDKTLSETSVNAVQNKVITQALNKKADKTELSKKQDVISDLSEIRNKAKSALQSVPSEYVTESELANKGYLTEHQDISGKQDKIADLAQIRANAQKGATALQTVPAEYATKTDVSKEVAKIVNSAPEAFNTLKEIADWIKEDAEPAIVLANKVEQKVDKVEGLGLSQENFTTEDKEKLAGLENYDDSGIKKELANKAEKSEIPTKMSQLEQDVEIGSSYDDTEVKNKLARLEREKATKSELTELSEEIDALLDEKLYAYPVEIYEGPEPKVVGLGGEKLYNYIGEISIPADMEDIEGTLSGDIMETEYVYQSINEGVLQPYFDFEYEGRYFNLYIGNDKYGYASLKIELSEDPNNLKWFDAMGLGMFQEGPGYISFAFNAKDWTLHYRAYYVIPCNIKIYYLRKAQKLDVNLIPQEIARKEDISSEVIKNVKNYNNSKCFADFYNYIAENNVVTFGLHISNGELGSKLLEINNYMEGIPLSFQYEREDETNFYYSSDVADIKIDKRLKFLGPDNVSVYAYHVTPHKYVCKIIYKSDDTFDFLEHRTQGENILSSSDIYGIKIYLEYDNTVNIIDSAYYFKSRDWFKNIYAYLKNRYVEFILGNIRVEKSDRYYTCFDLEVTKEIDILSLESRLAALESINVNIEATLNTEV